VRGASISNTTGEIFGPALVMHSVSSDAEALELANSLKLGLAGYVFSADEETATLLGARLVCGEVKINTASLLDLTKNSTQSFWGSSGIGGHGSTELLSFFLGQRIVGSDDSGLFL
jgi:phenylacetaldehyde dehydrogenase